MQVCLQKLISIPSFSCFCSSSVNCCESDGPGVGVGETFLPELTSLITIIGLLVAKTVLIR